MEENSEMIWKIRKKKEVEVMRYGKYGRNVS
jgi:hypothetical protein